MLPQTVTTISPVTRTCPDLLDTSENLKPDEITEKTWNEEEAEQDTTFSWDGNVLCFEIKYKGDFDHSFNAQYFNSGAKSGNVYIEDVFSAEENDDIRTASIRVDLKRYVESGLSVKVLFIKDDETAIVLGNIDYK
jgi:hypothetical protein